MKDGGYVFPTAVDDSEYAGMSLRDYFAAKAMQGILANPESVIQTYESGAKEAYEMADAMLKAREQ